MSVAWSFDLDTDDDLQFATDVSAYVQEMNCERVIPDGARVAAPGRMVVVLDNSSNKFSPEAVGAYGVDPGRWFRVQATYSMTTYSVFTGIISSIRQLRYSSVELVVVGRLAFFDQVLPLPLFTDFTVDEVLDRLVGRGVVRDALYSTTGYVYAYVGAEVGNCVVAPDSLSMISFDTGVTTLAYYGDVYDRLRTGRQVFEELVTAEFGYFVESGDGTLTFENRDYGVLNYTSGYSYDGSGEEKFDYAYGSGIVNRVETRTVGRYTDTTTLWTSEVDVTIDPGVSEKIFRFLGSDARVVGVSGDLSFSGWQFVDSRGRALTSVSFTYEVLATGVRVKFDNQSAQNAYLPSTASITGTGIFQASPEEVVVEDLGSERLYGVFPVQIESTCFPDSSDVVNLARYMIGGLGFPAGFVQAIQMRSAPAGQFGADLLDLVTVTDSANSHSAQYRVRGVRHSLVAGVHETELLLARYLDGVYALVGVAGRDEVGSDTALVGY